LNLTEEETLLKNRIFDTFCNFHNVTRFSDLYVNWIKSNALLNSNKNLIDELLFSLGQKLKKEEKKRKE